MTGAVMLSAAQALLCTIGAEPKPMVTAKQANGSEKARCGISSIRCVGEGKMA
ncbi:hypothetical protein [Acetobacter orientalis]|uniref:hypothetical protein n=1 Tax=Acetobacter orientalis TaxID=146474 RepID=UPI0013DF2D40|nr:hypothetical protein [Acetobacter orientalis]MDN6041102.1 hypothetical protein [Acetobacter sp.]